VTRIRGVEPGAEALVRLLACLSAFAVAVAICGTERRSIYDALVGLVPHRTLYSFSPRPVGIASLMIALGGALLLSLPVLSYAFGAHFIRASHPKLIALPAMFVIGVVFCWYVVLPPAVHQLIGYRGDEIRHLPRPDDYIRFTIGALLVTGLAFELPAVALVRRTA
jgi:sec-independent protein translocase protein TatC